MVYRFYNYTLDPAGREVWHGTQRLALEPKVLQVLLYLLEHRDRVVSKAELLEQCWPATFVSESALTRCLARLRKALQAPPTAPPLIETRHRQGYRFVAEVTLLAQMSPPAPENQTLQPERAPLLAALQPLLPVSADAPPPPALPPSAPLPAPRSRLAIPEAERRQLTVLCGAVADASALAGRLDPEDFREVMLRYHAICRAILPRYGGQVVSLLGDRLLGAFGWPQAHEDDARRAVYAGLALVETMQALKHELVQDVGLPLAVQIGIHTGLVVVGAGEEDAPASQVAVGATPHLAATLQDVAAPETVVISAATYTLVQGYMVCAPLEEHHLAGTLEPSTLYQVLRASGAHGRLDVLSAPQLTPFVGREAERTVFWERVAQVRQGQGQVVLLRGEAGIGKSRLVQMVKETLAEEGFTLIAYWGSPYYHHTALHPVIEWLQQCVHGDGDTPESEQVARLETLVQQAGLDLHTHLPVLAALVSLELPDARYPACSSPLSGSGNVP